MTTLLNWLTKATFQTSDLTGGTDAGLLSTEQAREFIRLATKPTVILSDANSFDSASASFEVPRLSFAARLLRPGTEGTRLSDGDRVKPGTSKIDLSTKLFRAEVPVTDEVYEDNIEGQGFADTLAERIAVAVGRDVEEIAIKSNPTSDTGVFATLPNGGLVDQLIDKANVVDASAYGSYKELFSKMVAALPSEYRDRWEQLRLYVPVAHYDGYDDSLGDRGTALGDAARTTRTSLRFRGIPVAEVPLLSGTDTLNSAATTVYFDKYAFLTSPQNIAVGWHRRIRTEKFRDPREGAESYIVSLRFDVNIYEHEGAVVAHSIPATLA